MGTVGVQTSLQLHLFCPPLKIWHLHIMSEIFYLNRSWQQNALWQRQTAKLTSMTAQWSNWELRKHHTEMVGTTVMGVNCHSSSHHLKRKRGNNGKSRTVQITSSELNNHLQLILASCLFHKQLTDWVTDEKTKQQYWSMGKKDSTCFQI